MAIRPAPSLLELLLPTALADTLLWSPVPRPATPSTLRTSTVTDTQQTEEFLIGLPDNVVVFAPSTTTPVISSMGRVLKTTPGSAEGCGSSRYWQHNTGSNTPHQPASRGLLT